MGPTIQILKKAPFSWFWWSVSLQLTRYHCRFGRNFYLFLCGNYSGVCQSLFTQSQVIPSGENQQINWCCHTGKSNWFLKNIRNFRQGCHLAGTKRQDQNYTAASGVGAEQRCVRYLKVPLCSRIGLKWQQFVEVVLFFDLWFEEQFSVDYIQVSLCNWSWRNFCFNLGFQNSNRRVMISLQMAVRLRWSGNFFVWYPSFYTWKPAIGWSTFVTFTGELMVFTRDSLLPLDCSKRKDS